MCLCCFGGVSYRFNKSRFFIIKIYISYITMVFACFGLFWVFCWLVFDVIHAKQGTKAGGEGYFIHPQKIGRGYHSIIPQKNMFELNWTFEYE